MDIRTTLGSSKFLKASDLQGRTVTVKIDRCDLEKVGQEPEAETKNVLYFQDKDKCVVLNVTNANTLIEAFGFETLDWPGREIELYATTTDFQGKRVDCIRLRVPERQLVPTSAEVEALSGVENIPF